MMQAIIASLQSQESHGDHDPITSTPVLYLPTVAGSFVNGFVAGYLGYHDLVPPPLLTQH